MFFHSKPPFSLRMKKPPNLRWLEVRNYLNIVLFIQYIHNPPTKTVGDIVLCRRGQFRRVSTPHISNITDTTKIILYKNIYFHKKVPPFGGTFL